MVQKCVFLTLSLFVLALGRPQESPDVETTAQPHVEPRSGPESRLGSGSTPVPIISQSETFGANGTYKYSYETGNGIKVEETGTLKHVTGLRARGNFAADDTSPDEADIIVQTGSFSYTAPDGTLVSVSYVADENGFQPIGEHLPGPSSKSVASLRSRTEAGAPEAQQSQQQVQQQPLQPVEQQPSQQLQEQEQPVQEGQEQPLQEVPQQPVQPLAAVEQPQQEAEQEQEPTGSPPNGDVENS